MATDSVLGLFGMQSPQQLQQDYLSGLMVSPAQMGQQGLLQQLISTGANAGAMMGYGGGRLLGGKVAGEVESAVVNDALQQINKMDIKDPAEKMAKLSELLGQNPATAKQAMIAQQEAVKLKKQGYEMQGFENAVKAKEAVASVLAKNPNATSEELYSAAAPFSSDPEAIIKAVASKEARAETLAAKAAEKAQAAADRLEQIKEQNAARLEVARMQGATQTQIAQMQAEARQQTSQMMGQIRLDIARENNITKRELEASKRNTGVLAPSLQKEEGSDLELIDTYEAMSAVLDTPVKSLTPDEKTGVVALSLDPISRANYAARNYAGKSSPESHAYADLQASVAQAVNIKTDAAKGVQTDKDVLRFANALIEASARNDVKGTREALVKFQDAAKTAAAKAKVRVNSRRQAQNVGVYFTDVATPEGTAPSGGAPKRATKRFNPATGKLEVIGG